ncbi:hypothetical protein GTID1_17285 [Geobacillus thermodenitrificans]|uniref:type II restriction endonuclease n=1 Tax=Geobacillus thermodenitrificans TaxID=33940 RepID=UPI000C05AB83|nr:type II restriction endonuclease [Geobacillus thermodenitrificans]ATO38774.1 hypothetical protein GTID1_17285 [Geobacillus thermodenitrificans]
MNTEQFKQFFKRKRSRFMPSSLEMVNAAFVKKGFPNRDRDYFFGNPSDYVSQMRETLWAEYKILEKQFNAKMAEELVERSNIQIMTRIVSDDSLSNEEKVKRIVNEFTRNFDEHLYDLNLSNTQSRRSRAGKEFEYIIYKLLTHAEIHYDDQGVLGNERFSEVGLGKLVDCVIPGVSEYNLEKHKCALVSMKTTLRERWAEVPEELSRTGAQSMYLLTLDDDISNEKINTIYSHNVYLVVPDSEKNTKYANNPKVYGLTNFLWELDDIMRYWGRKQPAQLGRSFYEEKIEIYRLRLEQTNIESEKRLYEASIKLFEQKLNEI